MTYEELIVAVEKRSADLKAPALRLLWHLIATAINEGTNELRTTTRALADRLQCSRDKVQEAAKDLKPFMGVIVCQRNGYTFQLPAEWFTQARGIFTKWATVEKSLHWPGNQATSGLETRPPVDEQPRQLGRTDGEYQATSGLVTRPPKRTDGEYQATSGLETRPPATQNQQLADAENVDRSNPDPLLQLHSFGSIQHIACAKVLGQDQRADGMELLSAICTYHREYAPADRETGAVPEVIIARCLAVAPLGSLLSELSTMRSKAVTAGSSYGWYPAVFCQRLKGIHPTIWRAALRHFAKAARQQPQTSLDFSTRMTAEISQGMRKIS